jgi:hypothetical protein
MSSQATVFGVDRRIVTREQLRRVLVRMATRFAEGGELPKNLVAVVTVEDDTRPLTWFTLLSAFDDKRQTLRRSLVEDELTFSGTPFVVAVHDEPVGAYMFRRVQPGVARVTIASLSGRARAIISGAPGVDWANDAEDAIGLGLRSSFPGEPRTRFLDAITHGEGWILAVQHEVLAEPRVIADWSENPALDVPVAISTQLGRGEEPRRRSDTHQPLRKKSPTAARFSLQLAESLYAGGDTKAALDAVDRAIVSDEEHKDAWRLKSTFLYRLENFEEARNCARRAVELGPDDAVAWYDLACCAARVGDDEESLVSLARAVALEPSFGADAAADEDFAALRHRPRFQRLVSAR